MNCTLRTVERDNFWSLYQILFQGYDQAAHEAYYGTQAQYNAGYDQPGGFHFQKKLLG